MERTIECKQIRTLTEAEAAMFRAGLELLAIQGQKVTRLMAQAALDQNMPENLLWATK